MKRSLLFVIATFIAVTGLSLRPAASEAFPLPKDLGGLVTKVSLPIKRKCPAQLDQSAQQPFWCGCRWYGSSATTGYYRWPCRCLLTSTTSVTGCGCRRMIDTTSDAQGASLCPLTLDSSIQPAPSMLQPQTPTTQSEKQHASKIAPLQRDVRLDNTEIRTPNIYPSKEQPNSVPVPQPIYRQTPSIVPPTDATY